MIFQATKRVELEFFKFETILDTTQASSNYTQRKGYTL